MKYLIIVFLLLGCSQKEYSVRTKTKFITIENKKIPKVLLQPAKSPKVPIIKDIKKDENKIKNYLIDLFYTNKDNESKILKIRDIVEKKE